MRKSFISLLVMMILLCSVNMTAFAHDVPQMDKKGSIEVTMRCEGRPVPGGNLVLYRVGDVSENNGDYSFKLIAPYMESGAELKNLQSQETAQKLADYVKANRLSRTAKDIDQNGQVKFTDLELGLYLLMQTKAAGGYYETAPFLVTVPSMDEEKYVYDIDASPKVEAFQKPDEPESEPQQSESEPESEYESEPESEAESESESETESETGETEGTETLPTESDSGVEGEKASLPQTGQLNWPIPVLAVLGMVLFAGGWTLRFGQKKEKNEK